MGSGSFQHPARCDRGRTAHTYALEDEPKSPQEVAGDADVWYELPFLTFLSCDCSLTDRFF